MTNYYFIIWYLFGANYLHAKQLESGIGGLLFYNTPLGEFIKVISKINWIIQLILVYHLVTNNGLTIPKGIFLYLFGWIGVYTFGAGFFLKMLGNTTITLFSIISLIVNPILIYLLW